MKKLLALFIGLCIIGLFSAQARADGEQEGNYRFPPDYNHFVTTYHAPVYHAPVYHAPTSNPQQVQDNQSSQGWESGNADVQALKKATQ